ncbi:MAG: PEGA domain-containing protein [Bdellovibrionota bacterium]
MMKVCRISLLFFIVVGVNHSYAQSKPSVVVSPMRGEQSKPAVEAITNQLLASDKVLVVEHEEVRAFIEKYSSKQQPSSSKEAFEFFQQGKNAYQNLDMENAVDYFRKAERLYKGTLWDEDSFTSFRTTKFQLAQSFLALGRTQEARIQMEEVMLIDPSRKEKKLSEKYYSPQVRKLYEEVYHAFEKRDVGDVTIQVEPAGAEVFFDGQSIGKAPASLKNIPVGKHYFRFALQGFEEKVTEQFIVVGQNRVTADLASLQEQDAIRFFDTVANVAEMEKNRVTFLDEIGLSVGGDIFLFLTPLSGKVRGQLFDQRSQELSPAIEAQNPKELVSSLLAFIGNDGYVVKTPAVPSSVAKEIPTKQLKQQQTTVNYDPPKEPAAAKQRITKQWWFWPAVGVVVIGAGAGVYFSGILDSGVSSSTLVTEIP